VLGIDYYLIGAATKDVDFAVLIGSQKEYEALKDYLREDKGFVGPKANSFVLIALMHAGRHSALR